MKSGSIIRGARLISLAEDGSDVLYEGKPVQHGPKIGAYVAVAQDETYDAEVWFNGTPVVSLSGLESRRAAETATLGILEDLGNAFSRLYAKLVGNRSRMTKYQFFENSSTYNIPLELVWKNATVPWEVQGQGGMQLVVDGTTFKMINDVKFDSAELGRVAASWITASMNAISGAESDIEDKLTAVQEEHGGEMKIGASSDAVRCPKCQGETDWSDDASGGKNSWYTCKKCGNEFMGPLFDTSKIAPAPKEEEEAGLERHGGGLEFEEGSTVWFYSGGRLIHAMVVKNGEAGSEFEGDTLIELEGGDNEWMANRDLFETAGLAKSERDRKQTELEQRKQVSEKES